VLLAKPVTFMNNSGDAVAALARYYKVPLSRCLVVSDDLDQPHAAVRLRQRGGHGGHNGLRSIIDRFGGKSDFPRLKIGAPGGGGRWRWRGPGLLSWLEVRRSGLEAEGQGLWCEREALLQPSADANPQPLSLFHKSGLRSQPTHPPQHPSLPGIGRPAGAMDVASYVLQEFRQGEMEGVDDAIRGEGACWAERVCWGWGLACPVGGAGPRLRSVGGKPG
jgi:hypothetical protein